MTSPAADNSITLGFFRGNHCAHYGDLRIISAFQPIYSLAHRRIVGLEGLVRAITPDDQIIPPAILFGAREENTIFELDKLCQIIHLENFYAIDPPNAWLFLNVDPKTLSQKQTFSAFLSKLLQEKNYNPNRIVIEILESTIDDELQLEAQIKEYKDMGFLIAIDDFGAGHSNFERIWRIQPDIVKLDRGMLQKAGIDPSVKALLKGVTSMLHNCQCIVLAEGIETENEAMAAMDAQVDLVQGFYFAHPFLLSESVATRSGLWKSLYNSFDELTLRSSEDERLLLSPYSHRFAALTIGAQKKNQVTDIANGMFRLDRTIRLYQLAPDGSQCYSNLDSPNIELPTRNRLRVLSDTHGASWKRRDYFVNAVQNPGNMQITPPYFSISDGTLCITLSVMTRIEDGDYIICCDILFER
ncbi:sensor domain-containing phosphodiesterase [Pseudohongiella sp.]|uniref:EAL domain-containing protein n=1 Tax=marine sediment metagenome TaxID=412755 RepID=A0A0F9VP96_9ZZZZ|nr:EAL domain-containing protein [Pseudohongiella sp.]HDZ10144.1 EAL domain-containing protein [Pseudohongiella sp.]HEA64325.1 EAL domain-containing protein [Pseudohongiella sp.]